MAELVRLSKERKRRDEAKKQAAATSNAVKFGRTKAEKRAEATRVEMERRVLDGHLRE